MKHFPGLLLLSLFLVCVLYESPAAGGEPAGDEASLPDLSGTWAQVQIYSEVADFPILGKKKRATTIVLLLRLEQEGRNIELREEYCATDIESGTRMVSTSLSDAFLRSLGKTRRSALLERSDGGIRFVQPWTTDVRGARLENIESDPLPTKADDPRLVDQDGDGKPGVTARAEILNLVSAEVYAVQRVRYRLTGTVIGTDRIEGLIEWSDEHIVLGSSPSLPWTDAPGVPDPVPGHSRFISVRVDPDTDCAALRKNWKGLFSAIREGM